MQAKERDNLTKRAQLDAATREATSTSAIKAQLEEQLARSQNLLAESRQNNLKLSETATELQHKLDRTKAEAVAH